MNGTRPASSASGSARMPKDVQPATLNAKWQKAVRNLQGCSVLVRFACAEHVCIWQMCIPLFYVAWVVFSVVANSFISCGYARRSCSFNPKGTRPSDKQGLRGQSVCCLRRFLLLTLAMTGDGMTCSDDGGKIKIESNTDLTAFAQRGCTIYNGTWYVRGAVDITSLEAASGLTSIINGQLYIRDLPSLTSLYGLRNLRGGLSDSLIVRNNGLLTSFEGLEGISAIGTSGRCDEGLCMCN